MIKSLILSMIILTSGAAAFSQEVFVKPSLGMNFTNFSKNATNEKYKAQIGYDIGGSVSFGQKLYLEPGIFYSKRSTNYSYGDSASIHRANFAMHGVRVPIAVGYHLIGGEDRSELFRLRVFAGGTAFLIRKINSGSLADYHRAEWGVFAGAGVDLAFLFLEAKYEWSLTNLQKDVSQSDVGKTRTVMINGGFRIPVGVRR